MKQEESNDGLDQTLVCCRDEHHYPGVTHPEGLGEDKQEETMSHRGATGDPRTCMSPY